LENLVVNGGIILEMGWEDMDCMDLDQNRDSLRVLMHGIVTFRFQLNGGNFFTGGGSVNFSGRTLLHGVNYYLL